MSVMEMYHAYLKKAIKTVTVFKKIKKNCLDDGIHALSKWVFV